MPTAWIALGANLPGPAGPAPVTLDRAIEQIDALPATRVTGRSRRYRSAPVDATGPDFLNQVVRVETGLAPAPLLARLHAIEARLGRVRDPAGPRNAPRSLDLDLLLVEPTGAGNGNGADDDAGNGAAVTPVLPHPRMHERRFVLLPLADLDPDLSIPGIGPIRACLDRLGASAQQPCEPVDR